MEQIEATPVEGLRAYMSTDLRYERLVSPTEELDFLVTQIESNGRCLTIVDNYIFL